MNYKLPPQNLGNLDPEKRVEFVRAQGISEKSSGSIRDSDDIPEASTSVASTSSGFASIYQNIIDRTTVPQNTIKTEVQGDSDDDVIILEDVVKTEPERNNLDIRDVNGFLRAAKDGNLEEIRRFLKKKIPIDVTDFYGWSATMCAAAEGNFEICKYLLENGADPGIRDKNGMGILQVAQKNRHKDFVKKLFDYFCKSESESTSSEPEELTFCELCNVFIPDSATSDHISSITHQLNDSKAPGAAPQSGIQLGPSNIGYRLMCASGWTEEKGLGRNSKKKRF